MLNVAYTMGCLFSKLFSRPQSQEQQPEPAKAYSWDSRPKVNPKDYMVDNVTSGVVYRLPGSINGQQFIIQNCQNCRIFILDHIATITVDDCKNCQIVVGPVKSSIFVRDCHDCKMVVACQQFRSRDCARIDVSLYCVTQPIIEASTSMRFSCFQYYYSLLEDQFRQAALSVFNNNWSHIHDFTPVSDEQNFSLLPVDADVKNYLPIPESTCSVQVNVDPSLSVVPQTLGLRRKTANESCFVLFFHDNQSSARAKMLIKHVMTSHGRECVLVQTKEVQMLPSDAQRILATSEYSDAVQRGPVIGLEFSGEGAGEICHNSLAQIVRECPGPVYISPDSSKAAQQIESFYSVADMMMAV